MNNELPFSLLLAAFTGALMLVLPHISPFRYFFAITVPPGFRETPTGRSSLRRYYAAVVCSLIIAVIAILQLDRVWPNSAPFFAMLIPAILGILAFLWERDQVAKLAPPPDSVREVDLTSSDDQLPRWIGLVLPPFAFPIACAAYLRAHWNDLPARIPIHWNGHNEVDRWADKSIIAVYGPVLFAGGMMLIMVLLTLAMFYGSRRGRQRTAIVKMMVGTIYFLAILSSGISLMPALQISPTWMLVPGIAFPALLLIWIVRVLRDPRMPADSTPDECWYLGSIYVNRNDPAIFVQRRIGFGYTLNMGNRLAWIVMVGFAAALGGLVLALPK